MLNDCDENVCRLAVNEILGMRRVSSKYDIASEEYENE